MAIPAVAVTLAKKRLVKIAITAIATAGVGGLLVYCSWKGYEYPWTGFASQVDAEGKTIPPKRLWDWLSLLIVPLFLAITAWLLNNRRSAADARIEEDRQRQKALDDYLAWMTEVAITGKFDTGQGEAVWTLARTKTLTILRTLDGGRKAQILQFLFEARMIDAPPKIMLNGADFSDAKLDGATLTGTELRGVHFENASLRGANLTSADVRGSSFNGGDFTGARLDNANFTQAKLVGANLLEASVVRTIFDDADMRRIRPPGLRTPATAADRAERKP